MTPSKPIARLFFAAAVAALVALPGCGASPTAPKAIKSTKSTTSSTAAKPVAAAATTPVAAKTATTATTAVAAKPTTADETKVTPEEPATHESTAVGTKSTSTIEAIAESALSADTKSALDSSLSAEVVAQKNGVLFGMGTFKATVQVTNNSDTVQTGMLKVTFMNKDKPSPTDPTLQVVTIPAHVSLSFDFEDKKWSTDNVVTEVTPTTHGQSLAAFVLSKKNGVILGMGTFKTTIEVVNPDDVERTGTLIVQFRNGSKDAATEAIHQTVTLAAHATKTFDFEDKKWTTDNVAVTVE
ncbi:MAG: hypothetical protein JWM80_703 [Cyanobacteria bacterium RYN_339]|nr:hypothetical protein [Cyanobacteria bacterium RYN_339]